jgi:hypothetical protein
MTALVERKSLKPQAPGRLEFEKNGGATRFEVDGAGASVKIAENSGAEAEARALILKPSLERVQASNVIDGPEA